MILTLFVLLLLFCLVWWLIGYAAPPDLVKPLRIVLAVLLVVWIIVKLLPLAGVTL